MATDATKLAQDISGLAGKLITPDVVKGLERQRVITAAEEELSLLRRALRRMEKEGATEFALTLQRQGITEAENKIKQLKKMPIPKAEAGTPEVAKPAYASGGNPNSCRLCGRDTMSVFGNIEAMKSTVELVKTLRDPRYIETFNMPDWADKLDRALVDVYKTCSLKDFPAMRFRIGELRKDIIKSDWPAVGSRLLDIEARLSMTFETPE